MALFCNHFLLFAFIHGGDASSSDTLPFVTLKLVFICCRVICEIIESSLLNCLEELTAIFFFQTDIICITFTIFNQNVLCEGACCREVLILLSSAGQLLIT